MLNIIDNNNMLQLLYLCAIFGHLYSRNTAGEICLGILWFARSIRLISYPMVYLSLTRQVTRAMHVRNRVCPRVELILKIIIILLIIFLGFIKSKPC